MEHLSLEIFDLDGKGGSKYAALSEDTSISITDTSEVFASGDVWSFSFTLNVRANAHIVGTSGDIHGSRLHDQLHKRRARLWVEGIALYLGYLKLDDEAEVDGNGNIDVSFESGQKTFDQLIEGGKANQVPMINDVLIGMALWRKRWTKFRVKLKAYITRNNLMTYYGPIKNSAGSEIFTFEYDGEKEGNSVQEYPRMVYPSGTFKSTNGAKPDWSGNLINTDTPYTEDKNGVPSVPYCNVALCYQKYDYKKTDADGRVTTDYSAEPEAQRGYELMPADRVNSAPNFYVIYWLRALMHHLGIYVEENQMLEVEDLRRLFFVNTKCAYEEPKKLRTNYSYDDHFGSYYHEATREGYLTPEYVNPLKTISMEESGLHDTNARVVDGSSLGDSWDDIKGKVSIKISEVEEWTAAEKTKYLSENNKYHKAYASSECFPDVDISDAIKAIENGFGVRLLFDDNYQRVRIVLLRNIFRSTDIQEVECDIIGQDVKVENNIRGFRLTYGDSEDTHFYYKGFADLLPHKKELWIDKSDKHDYSHWDLNAEYATIINKISAFDKTCYITPNTGNSFGIKIDKDAKRYDLLYPSLFEFAGFMDAEDGDCTGEEDTIETIDMGFTPAIMNDLNMDAERGVNDKQREAVQKFALFVDEEMRPRRYDLQDGKDYNDPKTIYDIAKLYADNSPAQQMMADDGIVKPGEFFIMSDMFAEGKNATATIHNIFSHEVKIKFDFEGHINEGYRLYLQDNFQPNDDGVCPVENHDWGLTLGIMRGSGDDATIKYFGDPDDQEQNDTWERVPGSNVVSHPDTCDCYGNEWDYNGDDSGVGERDGRVSLKLRAERLNPDFDPKQPESASNPRYLEITNENLRQRGLMDQFYKEYSFWTRNARICKRTVRMTLAQLLAIDKTKRVKVGDITGFIRKMQYSVSNKTGLGLVTLEIMYI